MPNGQTLFNFYCPISGIFEKFLRLCPNLFTYWFYPSFLEYVDRMDGVSVVASCFAIASLPIQLLDTVCHINDFLRTIRNAPDELTRLVEVLDQFRDILEIVRGLLQHQKAVDDLGQPFYGYLERATTLYKQDPISSRCG